MPPRLLSLACALLPACSFTFVKEPSDAMLTPELGIDLGRLRLAATYSAILGTSVEYRQTTGGIAQREGFSQSYLSLEASLRFGGGRKPASPAACSASRRSRGPSNCATVRSCPAPATRSCSAR